MKFMITDNRETLKKLNCLQFIKSFQRIKILFLLDKSIVLTRFHVLITHHIWLVFEKYTAPSAELITSLLDNLVKINNLYRLTICHNPVADKQKKRDYRKDGISTATKQQQRWYNFFLCQLHLRKDSYTSYFCHSHSSLATILYQT